MLWWRKILNQQQSNVSINFLNFNSERLRTAQKKKKKSQLTIRCFLALNNARGLRPMKSFNGPDPNGYGLSPPSQPK